MPKDNDNEDKGRSPIPPLAPEVDKPEPKAAPAPKAQKVIHGERPKYDAAEQAEEARKKDKKDESAPDGPAKATKVGEPVGSEALYSGVVTVTSVSGEYDNSKISTRIDIGSQPRGLNWLKQAFLVHFPSANVDGLFEVDPENKADPALRTKFD